jgi:Ciliary basal body-associated, B9 protein
LDVTFCSTNVHGWPQLVLSVYGNNFWGNDVVRGYGSIHVPLVPGRHVRYIKLFVPQSSSLCQRIMSCLKGEAPELFDPRTIADSRGREVLRVASSGIVKVVFNVSSRNMAAFGYTVKGDMDDPLRVPAAHAKSHGGAKPVSNRKNRSRNTDQQYDEDAVDSKHADRSNRMGRAQHTFASSLHDESVDDSSYANANANNAGTPVRRTRFADSPDAGASSIPFQSPQQPSNSGMRRRHAPNNVPDQFDALDSNASYGDVNQSTGLGASMVVSADAQSYDNSGSDQVNHSINNYGNAHNDGYSGNNRFAPANDGYGDEYGGGGDR